MRLLILIAFLFLLKSSDAWNTLSSFSTQDQLRAMHPRREFLDCKVKTRPATGLQSAFYRHKGFEYQKNVGRKRHFSGSIRTKAMQQSSPGEDPLFTELLTDDGLRMSESAFRWQRSNWGGLLLSTLNSRIMRRVCSGVFRFAVVQTAFRALGLRTMIRFPGAWHSPRHGQRVSRRSSPSATTLRPRHVARFLQLPPPRSLPLPPHSRTHAHAHTRTHVRALACNLSRAAASPADTHGAGGWRARLRVGRDGTT